MTILTYKRSVQDSNELIPGSLHFKHKEHSCRCGECEEQLVHHRLYELLDKARERLGDLPMIVTSGYRCPKHNAAVGGAPHSRHMQGDAVDIKVKGRYPFEVAAACEAVGFSGIKVYNSWVHADLRQTAKWMPNRHLWVKGDGGEV